MTGNMCGPLSWRVLCSDPDVRYLSTGKISDLGTWIGDPASRLEGAEEKSQTPSALAFAHRIRLKRRGNRLMQSKVTVDTSTCNFECRSRTDSRAYIGDHRICVCAGNLSKTAF